MRLRRRRLSARARAEMDAIYNQNREEQPRPPFEPLTAEDVQAMFPTPEDIKRWRVTPEDSAKLTENRRQRLERALAKAGVTLQ